MTTIIAYHVEPGGAMERKRENWGATDTPALLDMLAQSARNVMPYCRLVLATDQTYSVDVDSPWERFRNPRRDDRVAIHRMETQAAFLSHQPPGNYLFVDTDILINRDPTELFSKAPLGLCSPFEASNKINAGVIYVADPIVGKEWFSTAAEVTRRLSPEEQIWMGDQTAMIWMMFKDKPGRKSDDLIWNGHSVHIHASSVANWSPVKEDTPDDARDAFIWHFKGPRKRRMMEFYQHLEGTDQWKKTA